MCGLKLLIHSQTSTAQHVIQSYTLQGMALFVHAEMFRDY